MSILKQPTPLECIYKKCIECTGIYVSECTNDKCPLYIYRQGKIPCEIASKKKGKPLF